MNRPAALEIEAVEHIAGPVVLGLRGELDIATADLLKAAGQPHVAPARLIVLDLSGVTFCDSAGLGAIVALLRDARDVAATVALAGANEQLTELLRITGIDQVARVTGTVENALTPH